MSPVDSNAPPESFRSPSIRPAQPAAAPPPLTEERDLAAPPWRGLPPLAGLCTFADAARPGIPVKECVDRLKRMHYALRRLSRIWHARLTGEPVYELKMAFSHHAYLASEHVDALRRRVAEMRHPPLGLDDTPDSHLEIYFDEIESAPDTVGLLTGIYGHAIPALLDAVAFHLNSTNRLADAPTVRLLRFARMEFAEMLTYGHAALEAFAPEAMAAADRLAAWSSHLDALLAAAGRLDGTAAPARPPDPPRLQSAASRAHVRTPARDERFPDPYNMGVHAEQFLYREDFPAEAKSLMLFYKRLREIDVPEMMATILVDSPDRPWTFHRDMARQLWDEARHAMMGEVGFLHHGIDWPRLVMINFTWSKGLNEQLTVRERHAVLWFIEQGLMSRTGKRYEWEVGLESGDPLAALFQDYDWADEVLHARIGREWYVDSFDSLEAASAFGNACWSKVVTDWQQWKDDGLTEHRNWWPDLYREYCRLRHIEPAEAVLAFSETYAATRADLERIAASA